MVPPCNGCGWPNTATARGSPSGSSSSASSRPAGPAISRRKSDAIHEPFEYAGERIGPRYEAIMASAFEHHVFGAGKIVQVTTRDVDRHDAIQSRLPGHDE